MKNFTHIVELDIPSRHAHVYEYGTPNVFAAYRWNQSQCDIIAKLLNYRMEEMGDRDREIPVSDADIESAAGCKIDQYGNCV